MKKIVTITVFMLLLVIVCGGCETAEQKTARQAIAHSEEMKAKARRIKKGDSEQDVIRWLGQPNERDTKGSHVGIVTAYWNPRPGVSIGFIFDYGRVKAGVLTDLHAPDPDADNDGAVWLIKQ